MAKLLGYAACLLFLATALRAGFVDNLTPPEQAGAGLTHLSPPQLAALNELVDHDQTLAREGGVTGFARSFLQRRTPLERARAGLEQLTSAERDELDSLVAFAIANPPPEIPHFIHHPKPTAALVAPPPAPPLVFTPVPLKPEVHGDLSFTVGGGKGVSFYGSTLDLYVIDPQGRYAISVSLSQFHGKGPISPCLLDPSWPWFGPAPGPYPYPLRDWPPLPPLGP